ncbi:MAG: dTMP kinase, partial [Pseudomonadales bacterium]|nr:dTMP kinase [Pseudomonadales bacterium]
QWVQQGFQPDLTLLLDADVDVGLARAADRGRPDRFELEQRDFYQRIRDAYLARAAAAPGRFAVIDAAQSLSQVQTAITSTLDAFWSSHVG